MKNLIAEIMKGPDAFSVREILVDSWKTTTQYWAKAILFVLGYFAFMFAFVLISGVGIDLGGVGIAALSWILFMLLYAVYAIGFARLILWAAQGKEFSFFKLLNISPKTLFSVIAYVFLATLIVMVGFVLFFIPGYYFALLYSQGIFLILDKGVGPIEALKLSSKISKPQLLNIFSYWTVTYGLMYVLIIPFYFIGLFGAVIYAALPLWLDQVSLSIIAGVLILVFSIVILILVVVLAMIFWFGLGHMYKKLSHHRA